MYTSYQSIYSKSVNSKRNHHRYRLDIRRFRRFIILTLLVMILFIACGSIVQAWVQDKSNCNYKEVIVMNGDTLWNIAKQYIADDMDIRDFVDEIAKHNKIQGGKILSGEVIEIPLHNEASRR